jgi:hypothetical protein
MTDTWTCPACGASFAPKAVGADVQCPRCGALQPPPPPPPPPERTPPEARAVEHAATVDVPVDEPSLKPRRTAKRSGWFSSFVSAFAPTILACVLFVGWVAFDRMVRLEPARRAQELVAESVKAYRNGRAERSRALLQEALRLEPDLAVAREVELLMRQLSFSE